MFKIGQLVYGIEVKEDDFENAEVVGYLFMSECSDYIICCSEYMHHEGDFNSQLQEMYEESVDEQGVEVNILKKEYVFETYNQANDMLDELINCDTP